MFKLNLVTPEKRVVFDQELEEVTLPAFAGELNVLPGHAPLVTTLDAGLMSYRLKNGETAQFAISWGYCQVSSTGVSILAENLMAGADVDVTVVTKHLREQEAKLSEESLSDQDWEKTHHELARLKAELLAASQTNKR